NFLWPTHWLPVESDCTSIQNMKLLTPTSCVGVLAGALLFNSLTVTFGQTNSPAAQENFRLPSKDSPEAAWWRESMKTRDERLAWWREARFGMFIHWGVYSG